MGTFEYHLGEFACESVPLAHIAEQFGTPAYVYSKLAILTNFGRVAPPHRVLGRR